MASLPQPLRDGLIQWPSPQLMDQRVAVGVLVAAVSAIAFGAVELALRL